MRLVGRDIVTTKVGRSNVLAVLEAVEKYKDVFRTVFSEQSWALSVFFNFFNNEK